ncbi:hypothetical protein V8C86DRAFT_2828965 [Haematococcus lacustris]
MRSRRVLLVGELKSSGNGCVTLRTSDDGEVTVLLNTASTEPWDAQYVEILGQVIDQRTVKEETHVNFGNNLDMRLYNEMVKLCNTRYASCFVA